MGNQIKRFFDCQRNKIRPLLLALVSTVAFLYASIYSNIEDSLNSKYARLDTLRNPAPGTIFEILQAKVKDTAYRNYANLYFEPTFYSNLYKLPNYEREVLILSMFHDLDNLPFYEDVDELPRVKRLPDVIMLGVKKCGTGAFREFFQYHPNVTVSNKTEIHYFDKRWYNVTSLEPYLRQFEAVNSTQVLFEKTPGYNVRSYVPYRMLHTLSPHRPKFLVQLCDPVERTFSDWNFEVDMRRRRKLRPYKTLLEFIGEEADFMSNQSYKISRTAMERLMRPYLPRLLDYVQKTISLILSKTRRWDSPMNATDLFAHPDSLATNSWYEKYFLMGRNDSNSIVAHQHLYSDDMDYSHVGVSAHGHFYVPYLEQHKKKKPYYLRFNGSLYHEYRTSSLEGFVNEGYDRRAVNTRWVDLKPIESVVTTSMYSVIFHKWFKLYPREQFLFLDGERFLKRPAEVLKLVEQFLGLPEFFEDELFKTSSKGFKCFGDLCADNKTKGLTRSSDDGCAKYIDDETRRDYAEFFKPYNEAFFEMLGRRFEWSKCVK